MKTKFAFYLKSTLLALIITLTFNTNTAFSNDDFECGVSNAQVIEYLNTRGYDVTSVKLYKQCDRIAPIERGSVIVYILSGRITGHEEVEF